ncbi:MAG: HAD family phosphatase [Spirochaetales bacterium]|nr:HAD family phosphatase [Spirochaetales bacterium]
MSYHAVIFDMDGLMFDTERLSYAMWEKAGKEKGYSIPESVFSEITGCNVTETEKILKGRLGQNFPYHELRTIRLIYTDYYLEKEGVPVKRGLFPLLSLLKKMGIKKAVATSTEKARAVKLISLAGILQDFDCIVGGDDVEKSKPEPDIFLEAARRLKTDPAGCIVLEDSERGVFAALKAGMFPIMVPDMKPAPRIILDKGIPVYATLDDVVKLLETLQHS